MPAYLNWTVTADIVVPAQITVTADIIAGPSPTVTFELGQVVPADVTWFQEWKGWEDRFSAPPAPGARLRHGKYFQTGALAKMKGSGF